MKKKRIQFTLVKNKNTDMKLFGGNLWMFKLILCAFLLYW